MRLIKIALGIVLAVILIYVVFPVLLGSPTLRVSSVICLPFDVIANADGRSAFSADMRDIVWRCILPVAPRVLRTGIRLVHHVGSYGGDRDVLYVRSIAWFD